MIEKVYVLNLPHRQDRKFFMIGHLETIGVPEHLVEFFPAKYGKDYKSLDAIIDDAIADGFPNLGKIEHKRKSKDTPATFSYLWNWCRMLREIQRTGKITLILLDDRMLTIEWDQLTACIRKLILQYPPFNLLQLGWEPFGETNYMYLPGELINGLIMRGTRSYGDYATVLSPEGTSLIFDATYDGHFPEWYLWLLSRDDQPQPKGLFHCIESQVKQVPINWGEDVNRVN